MPLSLIVAFHSAVIFTATTVVAEVGTGAGARWHAVLRQRRRAASPPTRSCGGSPAGSGSTCPALACRRCSTSSRPRSARAALPAALFALGANLSRFRLARTLARGAAADRAQDPAAARCWSTCWPPTCSAWRPVSLAVAVTIAALPTGINAYLFAARYDAAIPEATSTILLSTLVSTATLALLLTLLHGDHLPRGSATASVRGSGRTGSAAGTPARRGRRRGPRAGRRRWRRSCSPRPRSRRGAAP